MVSRAEGESLGGVTSISHKLGWVGVIGLKLAVRRVISSDLANEDCSSTGCGCWGLCLRDVFRRLMMLDTNWLGGALTAEGEPEVLSVDADPTFGLRESTLGCADADELSSALGGGSLSTPVISEIALSLLSKWS